MPNRRDSVPEGTLEAARLQRDFKIQEQVALHGGRIDVFAAIIDKGAQLVFKRALQAIITRTHVPYRWQKTWPL